MATMIDRSARPVPLTANGYDKVPAVAAIAWPTAVTLLRWRGDWQQRLLGTWLFG